MGRHSRHSIEEVVYCLNCFYPFYCIITTVLPFSLNNFITLSFHCYLFHREVYKYAYSPDGSLTGYVNNSLSYFNIKDFSDMALPRDPFKNLPYNKSYCRSVDSVGGGGGGEEVLPIMAYTGRLRPKGVPFPRFRYMTVLF